MRYYYGVGLEFEAQLVDFERVERGITADGVLVQNLIFFNKKKMKNYFKPGFDF